MARLLLLPLKLVLLVLALLAAGVWWQQGQLAVLALQRLDPVPAAEALVAAGRYAQAADYLGFFLGYDYVQADPRAVALQGQIDAVRARPDYQAGKVAEGLWTGTSDEAAGQWAGLLTDLFFIGDLRVLAQQGERAMANEPVDEVLVALAAIGLLASAVQWGTDLAAVGSGGAATPAAAASAAARVSLTGLKTARRLGRLPPWLGDALVDGAQAARRTGKLDEVAPLLADVYRLTRTPGGLELLGRSTDAASLRRLAQVADTFGGQSATLLRIGDTAFLRAAARAPVLGADNIRLATTWGPDGLRALDRLGAVRFIQYSARAGKIAWQGNLWRLLARWLAALPIWLLATLIGLAVLTWVPWGWLRRGGGSG